MEVIEVGSYTANEKFHIAKEHLIKKQIKENGLLVSDVKFTDKVIRTIINSYTREAGVRGLERQIAKIVRKVVSELYKAGVFTPDGTRDKSVKKTVNISDKNITDYLGKVKYRPDKKNPKGEVGIVRGLAWTQAGGDTLEIEVITMPGKGEFKLTGNMGDVMKESASIAVSYIRYVTEKADTRWTLNISRSMRSIFIYQKEQHLKTDLLQVLQWQQQYCLQLQVFR